MQVPFPAKRKDRETSQKVKRAKRYWQRRSSLKTFDEMGKNNYSYYNIYMYDHIYLCNRWTKYL